MVLKPSLAAIQNHQSEKAPYVVFPQKPTKLRPPYLGITSGAARRNLYRPPVTLDVAASGLNGGSKYQTSLIFAGHLHNSQNLIVRIRSPQIAGGSRRVDPRSIGDQSD